MKYGAPPQRDGGGIVRVTGNEPELAFFQALGVEPDENSRPGIYEWYWTMAKIDFLACAGLTAEFGLSGALRYSQII